MRGSKRVARWVEGRGRSFLEKGPALGSHTDSFAFDSVKNKKPWEGDWAIFLDLGDKSYVDHTLQLLGEVFLILFCYFPLVPSPQSHFSMRHAHPLFYV